MTGILVEARRGPTALRTDIVPELQPAFDPRTKDFARQVDALRIRRSPTATVAQEERGQDLAEQVFDALASVKMLTSSVAMHLNREWRDRLFRQLDSLHDVEEWEEDDEPLRRSSFATFLKAILAINPARRPGLGLSHEGHLIAAWTTERDRLTIEFLPDDRIRWVLARYKDNEPSSFAGQTHVDELVEGLAPHRPERWFSL